MKNTPYDFVTTVKFQVFYTVPGGGLFHTDFKDIEMASLSLKDHLKDWKKYQLTVMPYIKEVITLERILR